MDHPLTFLDPAAPARALGAGLPQRAGPLTVLPLLGADLPGYVPPRSGLKISAVRGYGNLELECRPGDGLAIVPLHIGYIQQGAQNHAMCRAAFLGAGQKVLFSDACCVQAGQGGYLAEREQWFFVLPLGVREAALRLRGQANFSKLWPEISKLNARFGEKAAGHIELIVGNHRATLTQYASRLERLPGQRGAMFFLNDWLVGVEVAPSAEYFAEVWPALACFAYGAEGWLAERSEEAEPDGRTPAGQALDGSSIPELRRQLQARRAARRAALEQRLAALRPQRFALKEEESFPGHQLRTVEGEDFAGQLVQRGDGALAYLSLFAREAWLAHAHAA